MGRTVPEEIVGAIADAEGRDPMDLDVSLQNWVDVDAVQQLVRHDSDRWMLRFEVPDHSVTVTGDDLVLVDGSRERTL